MLACRHTSEISFDPKNAFVFKTVGSFHMNGEFMKNYATLKLGIRN